MKAFNQHKIGGFREKLAVQAVQRRHDPPRRSWSKCNQEVSAWIWRGRESLRLRWCADSAWSVSSYKVRLDVRKQRRDIVHAERRRKNRNQLGICRKSSQRSTA